MHNEGYSISGISPKRQRTLTCSINYIQWGVLVEFFSTHGQNIPNI